MPKAPARDQVTPRKRIKPAPGGELTRSQLKKAARLYQLTPRECDVIAGVLNGMLRKEIAAALGIKPGTVDTYCDRIHKKLGIHANSELRHLTAKFARGGGGRVEEEGVTERLCVYGNRPRFPY
jgi:DNA-binding NarL/FixJ family response regulator